MHQPMPCFLHYARDANMHFGRKKRIAYCVHSAIYFCPAMAGHPALQDSGHVISRVLLGAGLVRIDESAVLIKNNFQH